MGSTQERAGRWTSPRCQFLKDINRYDRYIMGLWIEGFPTWTKKAEEVVKKLLHKIIPRFGLPRSLQSDNGTSLSSKVTQGVSKALGITYLHCAWRPQSSGKVERANQFLKSVIKKDNPRDLPGMERGFTNSSPPHPYCPSRTGWS